MYICCCVNNLNRKFLNLPPLEQFMKMPPKKENSNNNQCRNGDMSSTFGNEHTAIITVSSTSNNNNTNNNNNCNENSNNYNNSNNSNNNHHSNATVITSLVTRSTTAALNVCSSSNNNTAINANNNSNNNNSNNHNNNSNSNYNNNNQNNNSATTMTMTDNGSTNQLMYVNDIAAEQRTIAYQANAKLCRLVRKCPWMYDRNHHNYAKKHILDKSWTKIAKECNDSVVSCKERWRNIRAAFARSINIYKTHSGPNRVKPYYLHKELTFLVKPMMEGRDRRDEFEEDSRLDIEASGGGDIDGGGGTEEEDDDDEELEQDDDDQEDQDEPDEMKSFEAFKPAITIHTDEYPLKNNIRMVQDKIYHNNSNGNHNNYECNSLYDQHNEFPSTSDAEAEFNFSNDNGRHIDRQLRSSNNFKRPMYLATDLQCDAKRTRLMSSNLAIQEADVCFLEAVLPDMALMNTRQKIIFKRKLYQTLEEVLENSTNFPCYQQSSQKDTQSYSHMNNSKCNNSPTSTGNSNISSNNNTNSNLNNNNNNNNSNSNVGMPTATPITTATTLGTGNQVRQTILTVNSSMARTLINSIAQLSEAELQKVSGFLQTHLRNHNMTGRLTNGSQLAPSSAAAHLMHSTPKITITKVTCPPPSALRNLNANSTNNNNCSQTQTIATPSLVQLSTPTVSTTALATQTIVHSTGMINSNVHSTTAVTAAAAAAAAAATAAATVPFSINTRFQMASNTPPVIHTASNTINNINNTSNSIQNGSAAWSQLLPITIKDEVEDVDID